ncbi:alpha/beta hydrolase [Erythrobacter litoralis]|uniref:Carboxylesterase family protein n=1 Tax=Erythrobacter litoralis (strain HTCC2594) TaxID=314225 RepID=Q2N7X4_ERYLH|nr:alpha/beta hydrolase [Erythrobacter litoralis]ABC64217.1 carboxylesterase family protein [Erythrobacter litoralis HTCC2594]
MNRQAIGSVFALALLLGTGAACSPLKTFNAIIPKDGASSQTAKAVAYGTDERQRLDIFTPDAPLAAGEARPVVVFFYGGSWNSGTRTGYDFVGRALAARGYVTLVPDYRLVPDVRYPAFVEDGAAAVRWARENAAQYGGDADRIVLVGHSAGAYIAAMLALDERWLGPDRAAVRGWAGLAGPYDFAPFDGEVTRAAFGNWPDPAETQPITWAGAGDPSTLLLTGGDDTTVEPRNSYELAQKLRASGVPAQVKVYDGVGHIGIVTSIAKPLRGNSPALDDIATFVETVAR